MKLVVALPPEQLKYWKTLCSTHNFSVPHIITEGGKTRYHSVKNAMEQVTAKCLVAVHDGVRPLISNALIQTCFDTAAILGNAVPAIEFSESIRKIKGKSSSTVDRSRFVLVQTPQVFISAVLIEAFRQPYKTLFTDEANLVEASGHTIHLIKGQQENIKITTMTDMYFATAILENINDF